MREDQKETDHPLCPTTSLGLKISVSCLKPRVFVLTTPVLKVKMAQGVLYGLSCSPSENGNTCPELRFTTSLLEKGPWGLQAASSKPLSSLATRGQVAMLFSENSKYLLCFSWDQPGASLQTLECFTLTVSTQVSHGSRVRASALLLPPDRRARPSLDLSLCPDATHCGTPLSSRLRPITVSLLTLSCRRSQPTTAVHSASSPGAEAAAPEHGLAE